MIKKLGDLYTDFRRIDLDARGGYARVSQVKILNRSDIPEYCAFKVMRHDLIDYQKGVDRFEGELRTLLKISNNKTLPTAITKIYDSGFVSAKLSSDIQKPEELIENTSELEKINLDLGIVSTGTDLNYFLEVKTTLKPEPNQWLPYIVVELATYDDSLLRQIRQHSTDPASSHHLFSTGEVVSMALQLLDVMEYLQQQELAYIDWKPEHIYWDNRTQQVKLIDWNVTTILKNNNERKKIIREDIRLFCGAALYCSLALNDPEDQERPIGPNPKLTNNSTSFFHRRYWTDEPNFYERGPMLDNYIKQLVKKGLDPNQGFDSPQEIKNTLLNYAEQNLNLPESMQSNTQALNTGVPRDAVQHYRRARSYIAAGDFQDAMASLTEAVDAAHKKEIKYSDAEKLLKIVKDRLDSDELKQKAKTAIKNKQWETALDFYDKAFKQDPTNVITSKDLDDVQDILRAKANDLQSKGILRFFTPLKQLRNLTKATKNVSGYDNLLIKSVDKQLNEARLVRGVSITTLLIGVIFILYTNRPPTFGPFFPLSTTPSMTLQASTPITATDFFTATLKPVISATPSITSTTSPTPTETAIPTSTEAVLGIGYINKLIASAWDAPNKGLHAKLGPRQPLTLLEQRLVSNSTWFRCRWEINGVTDEGWILGDNITFGNPPTPQP